MVQLRESECYRSILNRPRRTYIHNSFAESNCITIINIAYEHGMQLRRACGLQSCDIAIVGHKYIFTNGWWGYNYVRDVAINESKKQDVLFVL